MSESNIKTPQNETIFSSRIFKVVKRFITGRSGKQLERHIIVHPGAVVILPILEDGRIVLVRQYRVALGKEIIELPAGTLEPNEVAITTARRELIEETGYSAGHFNEIMSFYTSPGFVQEKMYLFTAENLIPGPTAMEDGEQIETVVLTLEEAEKLIRNGDIIDAKTIIGIYWLKLQQNSEV